MHAAASMTLAQLALVTVGARVALRLSWLLSTLCVVQAACLSLTVALLFSRAPARTHRSLVLAPVLCALIFGTLLTIFRPLSEQDSKNRETVSVVIPARFEKDYIAQTVIYTIAGINRGTLAEIILIDDASEDDIAEIIDHSPAIQELPDSDREKIKTVRLPVRQGLTRGKIIGAEMAKGTHILFLDGHCRIVPGAVEEMLEVAKQKDERIVVPVVTNVNASNWSHIPGSAGVKMFFHWNFEFEWVQDGDSDQVPVLSGGIFLISRKYWTLSGGYDPGMLDWGSENIEQSLRVWMCGGDIVVARNAKIGHIFDRPAPKNKVTGHVVQRNHARAALVWLDDRLQFFKKSHPVGKHQLSNLGPHMADRVSLRYNSKCASFREGFEKKFPLFFTAWAMDLNERSHIRHTQSGLCLAVDEKSDKNGELETRPVFTVCDPNDPKQSWVFRKSRRLFTPAFKRCLDRGGNEDGDLILYYCDEGINFNQDWELMDNRVFSRVRENFRNRRLCLTVADAIVDSPAKVRPCFDDGDGDVFYKIFGLSL